MKKIKRCYKDVWLDYMFFKVFGYSYQWFKRVCMLNNESIEYNIYLAYKWALNDDAAELYKIYFINDII